MKINNIDDLRGVLLACGARLKASSNGGRDAGETALFALMQFAERALAVSFGEVMAGQCMRAPAKLLEALYNLDHGVVDRMVQTDRPAHRGKTGLTVKVRKAYVAAAVDILMKRCQQTENSALKHAAAVLTKSGTKQSSGKPIQASTTDSWREDAMGRSDDAILVQEYRRLIATEPPPGETWQSLADRMLSFAAEDPLLKT